MLTGNPKSGIFAKCLILKLCDQGKAVILVMQPLTRSTICTDWRLTGILVNGKAIAGLVSVLLSKQVSDWLH